MIRRPPRSTLLEGRRQRQMCIRDRIHTSLFATFIHINATSTQLFPTANMHSFFDLPLPIHRYWCH